MRLAALSAVLTASVLSMLLPFGHLAAAPGDLLETSRTDVNVRAAPTTGSAIVATISSGERIIEIVREGEWFQVDLPDRATKGWIFGPLLDQFAADPEPPRTAEPSDRANASPSAAATGALLEISRTNVNVRAAPTTGSAIVAKISSGERIVEIVKKDEWVQVNLPDKATQGWIYGPLLNRSSTESASQTAAKPNERHSNVAAVDSNLVGNPERGETVFFKCGACHTTVSGIHAEGPSLVGIFGRPPASAPDYRYSGALRAFAREGAVWDAATLDRFIQRPGRLVKGTSMPYSGLRDPQDRRDVIAYLQELSR